MPTSNIRLKYHQPSFYHFSQDSISLVNSVYNSLQYNKFENISNSTNFKMLDLCCGCGVVGIELFLKTIPNITPNTIEIDFMDIQHQFKESFDKNISQISNLLKYNWLNKNFSERKTVNIRPLRKYKQYDLIISNPPYFISTKSRLSANKQKAICRHFVDCNVEDLILFISNHLSQKGEAFILSQISLDQILKKIIKKKNITNILSCKKIKQLKHVDIYKFQYL